MSNKQGQHDSGLQSIRIERGTFSGTGLSQLAACRKLSSLSFPYVNSITNEGLGNLSAFPELKSLDIGSSLVSDDAMTHLSSLTKLKKLYLRSSGIGDKGIAVIADTLPQLTYLNLSGCDITQTCVEDLSNLKNLKTLIVCFTPLAGYRDVFNTSRTDAVIALQRALSGCKVVYAD